MSSSKTGFIIGSILNAIGRVHDPNVAVKLLTSDETIVNDFKDLIELNTKRKSMTLE
ncbi:hypothetical protein [Salipaludibacillus sp. CF4.18]|uniref:hypothetical protein n=1 Tax=Salipaludibacillus sp. CF4.18 TaxID=3373081 RepID=UPI003EE49695